MLWIALIACQRNHPGIEHLRQLETPEPVALFEHDGDVIVAFTHADHVDVEDLLGEWIANGQTPTSGGVGLGQHGRDARRSCQIDHASENVLLSAPCLRAGAGGPSARVD